MKENRIRLLLTLSATALLLVAFLVVSVLSSGRDVLPIELPSPPPEVSSASESPPGSASPDLSPPVSLSPSPSPSPIVRVEVSVDNVQEIIRGLSRPEAYHGEWTFALYWKGGSQTFLRNVWVRDGVTKIEIFDLHDKAEKYVIMGMDRVLLWSATAPLPITNIALGDNITADDAAELPTYEDVLALPPESIQTADYALLDENVPCIYVKAGVKGSSYVTEYWISLENGLLVKTETQCAGVTTYRCTLTSVDESRPADEVFLLPDNNLAMDVLARTP